MSIETPDTQQDTTNTVGITDTPETNIPPFFDAESPNQAEPISQPILTIQGFSGPDQPRDDILQKCIRCGFCLPSCPTYVETYQEASSPRGRIHLIGAVASGTLDVNDPAFVEQMYQCLDCRACEAVCPSGVRYGQLVETARTQIERARRQRPAASPTRALLRRVTRSASLDGLFGDQRRFRGMGRLMRLYQRSGVRRLARTTSALEVLGLREQEALLPDLPASFLIPNGEVYPPLADVSLRGRVALLVGCVMGTVFAETDRATIRVLNANGFEVITPARQECCGALTIHAGEMERARALARQNILAFEQTFADGMTETDYIVTNAAGCGSALKEYGELFADDPDWRERAQVFASHVLDASELLGDLLARGELNTRFTPLSLRVTYQDACHLAHAQRITAQPRQLLRAIPGLELIEMEEAALCCGSAGVYNLTRPKMAHRLGERKAHHVIETDAQAVVTANPGCWLQLRASLAQLDAPIAVLHLMDVLDAAYRGHDPLAS